VGGRGWELDGEGSFWGWNGTIWERDGEGGGVSGGTNNVVVIGMRGNRGVVAKHGGTGTRLEGRCPKNQILFLMTGPAG